MKLLYRRCAGLDIHKESLFVKPFGRQKEDANLPPAWVNLSNRDQNGRVRSPVDFQRTLTSGFHDLTAVWL